VEPERLECGVAELRALGFEVRVPEATLARRRFTAGPAELRAAEITQLFEDPGIAGIVCARGGAGALSLLPLLDAERLRAHAKVLVGYSDVTFLHLLLNGRGVVAFHGPMVARGLDGAYDRECLRAALLGGEPYASGAGDLLTLWPGEAEGRLLGGCLSILAAASGTPWALRPEDDTLLFIEDVDEAPYRVERMLLQLRATGLFERVRGVMLGDFVGCSPAPDAGYTLEDVVLDALAGLDVPIARGLAAGHTERPQVTLPLGARARLLCDSRSAQLSVLEAGVA
jgi:muramoyltetrapeptide carboxypeptidase